MGKFDGVLICTDLDGTLFRNDGTISEENKEAIAYFKREGGYFTFITGRMPYYATEAYRAVCPNVPYGCVNGGAVYDGETDQYTWTYPMPDGFCELIAAVEKEFSQVGIQICGFERTYFARDNRATALFRERTGVPHLLCPYREVTEPVAKVLFCTDSEEDIGGVERALRAHPLADAFSFVRSERTLFEILPPGVQKGLALAKLTEQLGVDPRRTLAVGDYDNDVGMFRAAAFGIAVANASPAAKAAANCFTVSNEEHAIARVIADLESGKYALPTV